MKLLVLFFILIGTVFTTNPVLAAEGLVTCAGGDACNFCSFVDMVNGLIEWLIIVAVALTVLLLAFAGFRLITSAGDAAALEQAKKIFFSSIIGILIMLAGWTIVDTALKITAGGDLGVWNAVECGGAYAVADPTDINIELEQYEAFTLETEDEGVIQGFYFRTYTLDRGNDCKQLSTTNLPTLEMCRSALSDVTSSGNSYIIQNCEGEQSVGTSPGWSSLPICGVPTSPSGQICYPGSGNGRVCFDAYPAGDIVGNIAGYSYSGRSPAEFVNVTNPGQGNSMSTRISPNYTLADFNRSGTCGQGGNPYMYIAPSAVARIEQVNQSLGSVVGINSGYRSPSCNTRVSGASASQHMQGTGADLSPPGGRSGRCALVRACRSAGAGFIMTYNKSGHVHCDWAGSRGEKLTISCP